MKPDKKLTRAKKVVVGLSGGVDSAAAAMFLKKRGYEVTAAIMQIWDGSYEYDKKNVRSGCYGPDEKEDIEYAEKIAGKLDIPLKIIDIRKEYKERILDYFKHEYKNGRTPNPCVRCNHEIKFGFLVEKLKKLFNFDFFATGHYARIIYDKKTQGYNLYRGADKNKDQSYFLYRLSAGQLGDTLFPLGNYNKEEIRKMVMKLDLGIENKRESQNFASLGNQSILKQVETESGDIVDTRGNIVGRHSGLCNYTVGQRKSLKTISNKPIYVLSLNKEKNQIVAGEECELYSFRFTINNLNWIAFDKLKNDIKADVQIRYRHQPAKAKIKALLGDKAEIIFDKPQKAVSPGQSAVIYENNKVLGGGIINHVYG